MLRKITPRHAPDIQRLFDEDSRIEFDAFIEGGKHWLQICDHDVIAKDECSPNVFTLVGERAKKIFDILLEEYAAQQGVNLTAAGGESAGESNNGGGK